jgi:hypothetical protein
MAIDAVNTNPLANLGIAQTTGGMADHPPLKIVTKSVFDVVIDIAGIFFPLKSLNYAKAMAVDVDYGIGSRIPYWLTEQQIGFSGSFSYVSYVKDAGSLAAADKSKGLLLTRLLEDQDDEGKPMYFNIIVLDRTAPGGSPNYADFIEALVHCKLTSAKRDFPDSKSVVSSRDFVAMYRIPY